MNRRPLGPRTTCPTCYRDEAKPEVYLFDGRQFVYRAGLPRRASVILTPAGMLDRMRQNYGTRSRPAQ